MKKFLFNFRIAIRFIVSLISSREFAFMFVLFGVIAQISHTYFLVSSISSLQGWYREFQAILISVFISASLLYFVSITPKLDDDGIENENVKRILNAVTIFTIIEIIINVYYYTRHLILDANGMYIPDRILDFCFSVIVSVLIPWTIKLYSSQIRAKEWADEFELDSEKKQQPITEDTLTQLLNERLTEMDDKVSKSFTKHQDLFLNQFEKKLKTIVSQNATTVDQN